VLYSFKTALGVSPWVFLWHTFVELFVLAFCFRPFGACVKMERAVSHDERGTTKYKKRRRLRIETKEGSRPKEALRKHRGSRKHQGTITHFRGQQTLPTDLKVNW